MPKMSGRGAKPGERRGGRSKGTVNRTTTERALIAAKQVAEARIAGRPLAKEVLEKFMLLFQAKALRTQNSAKSFTHWAKLTLDCAKALAPYQSPQLRSIEQPAPPPSISGEPQVIRFGLRVFERDPDGVRTLVRSQSMANGNGHSSDEDNDGRT
jgi:hypothetical protein